MNSLENNILFILNDVFKQEYNCNYTTYGVLINYGLYDIEKYDWWLCNNTTFIKLMYYGI